MSLKYIKSSKEVVLECAGDLETILVDIGYLIAQIRHRIGVREAQMAFQHGIRILTRENSLLWDKNTMVHCDVDESQTIDLEQLFRQAKEGSP